MKFCFIGGDFRNIELAKMLAKDGMLVYTYGLERGFLEKDFNQQIIQCENLDQGINKAEIIITALPFSKDDKNINTPLSEEKLEIEEIINKIKGKTIFTGNISKEVKEKFNKENIKFFDILKNEEFAILNTVPTAEATIKIIIENTKNIIQNSRCLIMGFGRIGKILSYKMQSLSLKTTVIPTNSIEEAWGKAYGNEIITFENIKDKKEILSKYDIIINTIPKIILKEEELKNIRKDALIIDLASKPFGIDRNFMQNEKMNFIEALGLPRKNCTSYSCKKYKRNSI